MKKAIKTILYIGIIGLSNTLVFAGPSIIKGRCDAGYNYRCNQYYNGTSNYIQIWCEPGGIRCDLDDC